MSLQDLKMNMEEKTKPYEGKNFMVELMKMIQSFKDPELNKLTSYKVDGVQYIKIRKWISPIFLRNSKKNQFCNTRRRSSK